MSSILKKKPLQLFGAENQRRRCRCHSLRGSEGRPRHARNAFSDFRHHGRRLRFYRCFDYRRPLLRSSRGAAIGHVSPEAALGGPIGLIEEGDIISINIPEHKLDLEVSNEVLEERRKSWKPRQPKITTGYLARYAKLVSSGTSGAVLS